MKNKYISLLMVTMMSIGCEEEGYNYSLTDTSKDFEFSVSPSEVIFGYEDNLQKQVKIKAKDITTWEVYSSYDYTISPSSGDGDATITITAVKEETPHFVQSVSSYEREFRAKFGDIYIYKYITLSRFGAYMYTTSDSYTRHHFLVIFSGSKQAWRVSSDNPDVTFSLTDSYTGSTTTLSDTGSKMVYVFMNTNNTTTKRTATITATLGDVKKSFTLTQDAGTP